MRYIGKSVLYRPQVAKTHAIDTLAAEIKGLEGIIRKKDAKIKDLLKCYGEIPKWFYGDDEVILLKCDREGKYKILGYAPDECVKEVERYNKKFGRRVL